MIKEESVVRLFVVCSLLSMLMACATPTAPHENFKEHMSSTVGKRISDPYTWAREDRYVTAYALENGNMEHKYMFRGSCFYFFEVEKKTKLIVSWRFEGSEEDCVIVP